MLQLAHQENLKLFIRTNEDTMIWQYPASGDAYYGHGALNSEFYAVEAPWTDWAPVTWAHANKLNVYSNPQEALAMGESLYLTILIMNNAGQTGDYLAELNTLHEGYIDDVRLYGDTAITVPYQMADGSEFQDAYNAQMFNTSISDWDISGVTYSGYKYYRNLRYSNPGNDDYKEELCVMDIYAPSNATNTSNLPVLLFMHGGSIKFGTKDEMLYGKIGQAMAEEGVVMVNINYRLIDDPSGRYEGEADFPEPVNDVAAAFHWIKNRIGDYGGNPDKVFISGFSAGAYLTSIFSTDPQYLAAYGYDYSDIAGALPISAQVYEHSTVRENLTGVLEEGFITENGPLFYVTDTAEKVPATASVPLPDFLILVGDPDGGVVYRNGNQAFSDALATEGYVLDSDYEYHVVSGRGHTDMILSMNDTADTVRQNIISFISAR